MIKKLSSSGLAPPKICYSILSFSLYKLSYVVRMSGVTDESFVKFDTLMQKHTRNVFKLCMRFFRFNTGLEKSW